MTKTARTFLKFLTLMALVTMLSCQKDGQKPAQDSSQEDATVADAQLFTFHDSKSTQLAFRNTVEETYESNYLNYEFLYNGSGLGVGDLNNDGLPDIYFAGNSSDDKLYFNKGGLQFEDVSVSSGIAREQGWSTGVTIVDINADGWLDIYVCRSGPSKDPNVRTNKLYINNHDGTFAESAAEYGLDNSNYSIQSAFFDYDLDGDLDMYLLNHPDPDYTPQLPKQHMIDMKAGKVRSDNFYENVNGRFVERTTESKLTYWGYRHGIAVGDINSDGYPDLYISSDFDEPDVLAINQGDKTFKDEIQQYFSHISNFSMGNEMVDINNDGQLDVYVVDMAPEDHFRAKAYMKSMDVNKFRLLKNVGYHSQYMFNTMHLSSAPGVYSEVAQLSGTAKTDWSWSPLFFDMDLDGDKDLFISNGIKENFLFQDLAANVKAHEEAGNKISLEGLMEFVPSDISENVFYENINGAKFKKRSGDWAPASLVNSNGVATADFDNDGDLDFVTNNMNEAVYLYESLAADIDGYNFLKVNLKGSGQNLMGIGAKIEVITPNGAHQYQELHPTRGYLSSVDLPMVFGVGQASEARIKVVWPDGKESILENAKTNNSHTISYADAKPSSSLASKESASLVQSTSIGLDYVHTEDNFDDYRVQILLPHSQSNVGPSFAKADVDGDGTEDVFVGGASGQEAKLYIQTANGRFTEKQGPWEAHASYEDTGSVFFDMDNDGDQDLYVVSGGGHLPEGHPSYGDRLYENQDGNFVDTSGRLPTMNISGQAVAVSDIEGDGDLDLFIGGRLVPDRYPEATKSYFLINENGSFSVRELEHGHLVSEALFTDYDADGDDDLMTVGEWSPVMLFENQNGSFVKSSNSDLSRTTGLWFGLQQHDIDKDGDPDYFVGNLGLNAKFKAGGGKEFHIYADDFDDNGSFDVVLSGTYKGNLVPARGRECSSQQMPFIKDKFKDYTSFANATLEDIYGERLLRALHHQADMLHSIFIENLGNGGFKISKLPWQAQLAPASGFAFLDIDKDGTEELFTVGNLYNVEVETPRYDASHGAVLKFNDGNWTALDPNQTGFITTGDTRDVAIVEVKGQPVIVVTNNNGAVQTFSLLP